jgi:hypothetical protein
MVLVGFKILWLECATNLLQLVKQSFERQKYYEPRKLYKYPSKSSSFLSDWSCTISLLETRFALGSWIGKHEHWH